MGTPEEIAGIAVLACRLLFSASDTFAATRDMDNRTRQHG